MLENINKLITPYGFKIEGTRREVDGVVCFAFINTKEVRATRLGARKAHACMMRIRAARSPSAALPPPAAPPPLQDEVARELRGTDAVSYDAFKALLAQLVDRRVGGAAAARRPKQLQRRLAGADSARFCRARATRTSRLLSARVIIARVQQHARIEIPLRVRALPSRTPQGPHRVLGGDRGVRGREAVPAVREAARVDGGAWMGAGEPAEPWCLWPNADRIGDGDTRRATHPVRHRRRAATWTPRCASSPSRAGYPSRTTACTSGRWGRQVRHWDQ